MDRAPLNYEFDPGAGLFLVFALWGYTLCLCFLLAHWLPLPHPGCPGPQESCCLWCLGKPGWSSGSQQQHAVFMQQGSTSAALQWNAQINSPLLAVLPAEKTHGSSECSGARGGAEVDFSVHTQMLLPDLPWYFITLEADRLGREVETGQWVDKNQSNEVHHPFYVRKKKPLFPALSSNLFTMNIYFFTLTSFLYPNLPFSFCLSCHSLFLSALPHLLLLYHLFSENMKIWNGRGNTAHHQIPVPSPGNRGTILKRESRMWHSLIQSLSHLLDSVTQWTVWWEQGYSQAKEAQETKVKMEHLSLTLICFINSVSFDSHEYPCLSPLGSSMDDCSFVYASP